MKKICVIGNYSGRNAGDAAILETLLDDIFSIHKDVEFLVPTINKKFIENTYKRFPVKAVPMMPWNLSIKIFGLPIFKAVLQSDLVLVTDAILFDQNLWNPLFNYLSTMALVLPMAKRMGIPVVLYNCSLEPITSGLGRKCLKRVIDSSNVVIFRDIESVDVLKTSNITHENIKINADCALNTPLPDEERMNQIKTSESILNGEDPWLSFNVNSYIDTFTKEKGKGIGTEQFIKIIANTLDRIIEELGCRIIFVITQYMDFQISEKILKQVKHPEKIRLISNREYSHNEISGILSEVGIHVGMRTHSLILASSNCIPTVGILYKLKNLGFMRTIQQEARTIKMDANFTSENLFKLIQETWSSRQKIKEKLKPIVETEKKKASSSVEYLEKYLKHC